MKIFNLPVAIVFMMGVCGIVSAQPNPKAEEIAAKNKQIDAQNTAMQKALTDGAAAFAKKDYTAAIDIFQKAYSADPTHPTAPLLLMNIAMVQLQRSIGTFNTGAKSADEAAMSSSKADLINAEEKINSAQILAGKNKYPAEQMAKITDLQKQVFQKISYIFYYVGSMNGDNATLQRAANAAKAFLSLAAANHPNRIETEQILADLKATYNISPK